MKRYRFVADYRAGDVAYSKGQITEFSEEHAVWLNNDVPGCIELVDEQAERAALEAEILAKAKARAVDQPPADRMQRQAPAKREG